MKVKMRRFFFTIFIAFTFICITCIGDENTDTGEQGDAIYNLTLEEGEGGSYAAGTQINVEGVYKKGARISLPPVRPFDGYMFDKWVSSNGGHFDDANKSNTVFTMPASDTTVTATFKRL
jgi:uncharacterized repeat protein (TIGR02543 family)